MGILSFIDALVKYLAPTKKDAVASVSPLGIIVMIAPLPFFTDFTNPLQLRATLLLIINIIVRLSYPSAYYPASQSVKGALASPVTARLIAFNAEFALYEVWCAWISVDFWGPHYVWLMVLFGECVSTTGTLLQSELILNIEDTTWGIHAAYMSYLSFPQLNRVWFFGGFTFHMFVNHLPKRFGLMWTKGRHAEGDDDSLFTIDPLFINNKRPFIIKCPFEEKAWVVPMMLGQGWMTAIMYMQMNK